MQAAKSNIVLIGMPGSGKSTIGRHLGKRLSMPIIDADAVLEQYANMPIQSVVNKWGLKSMLALEEQVLMDLDVKNHIISTGGSAVYSQNAMQHLAQTGTRVYLKISLSTLMKRVNNVGARGLAKLPKHSLPRLYREREALFDRVADVTVSNNRFISAVLIDEIQRRVQEFQNGK